VISSLFQAQRCGIWKTVHCEHCRADFAYRLERPQTEKLHRSFDAVFCPQCGAYQHYMLRAVRRNRFGIFLLLAAAAVLAGFAVGGALGLAFHLLGVGLLATGQVKMARFDPNASCTARRGIRQHRHVIMRTEYEALRAHVRAKGERVVALHWQ
jgi:hypothetical protein